MFFPVFASVCNTQRKRVATDSGKSFGAIFEIAENTIFFNGKEIGKINSGTISIN